MEKLPDHLVALLLHFDNTPSRFAHIGQNGLGDPVLDPRHHEDLRILLVDLCDDGTQPLFVFGSGGVSAQGLESLSHYLLKMGFRNQHLTGHEAVGNKGEKLVF